MSIKHAVTSMAVNQGIAYLEKDPEKNKGTRRNIMALE